MAAIEAMLGELEDMGLSTTEINIFLNLKLRERAEEEALVKVAVVECNPENLSQMSDQLRHINGVDLYSYMLDNVRSYPYVLEDGFDLIVTTSSHAEYLETVLPVKKKLARVALRLSARSLSHVIKLRPTEKVGVIGYSERFAQLLHESCQTYAEDVCVDDPLILTADTDVAGYVKDKDAVLVPRSYEKYFTAQAVEALRHFKGHLIDCYYEMDEGSVLYLEAKIKRLLEEKSM